MLYGDVVTFLPGGIQMGPKAILPIGIFDNSVCWGVWVPDASLKDERDNSSSHLVVSSLHPRYWPYLLRFELKLNDVVGAMEEAAEIFRRHKLNILSGDSSPSGHHHATWNVVCEAVEVRREFEPQFDTLDRRDRKKIVSLATRLASRMYRTAFDARRTMKENPGFLHPRIITREPVLLHRVGEIADKHARALARMDVPAAVRVRWIQNLPVFALYGKNTSDPYVFKYNRAQSMLYPHNGGGFEKVIKAGNVGEPPTKAIASIYPEEHHVRLIPIRSREQREQWLEIEVSYEAKFSRTPADSSAEPIHETTIGLWADMCGKLAEGRVDLQRVTNTVVLQEPASEDGVLTILGRKKGVPLSQSEMEALRRALSALSEKGGRNLATVPRINRLTVDKVFISRRMNSHAVDDLVELVKERARYWGLQPVMVDNPVGRTLTPEITRTIGECAALFQIVTVSKGEFDHMHSGGNGRVMPELHWMWYEYGVAAGHNLPVARIVDVSVMPLEEWRRQLRVGADETLATYDPREFTRLKDKFDFAMRKLAEQVHGTSLDD